MKPNILIMATKGSGIVRPRTGGLQHERIELRPLRVDQAVELACELLVAASLAAEGTRSTFPDRVVTDIRALLEKQGNAVI